MTAKILEENKGRLRSFVGKQLGIRLTPSLEFIADAIPENAAHIEDLLRAARERDAEVAAAATGASTPARPTRTRRSARRPRPRPPPRRPRADADADGSADADGATTSTRTPPARTCAR